MALNGISTLATKELRQKAKLDLAATNRAEDGNTRAYYDITQLPNTYSGNVSVAEDFLTLVNLIEGRPWISSPPPPP